MVMGKVAVWCSGCGIVAVVRCVVMGKVAVWCSGCGSGGGTVVCGNG